MNIIRRIIQDLQDTVEEEWPTIAAIGIGLVIIVVLFGGNLVFTTPSSAVSQAIELPAGMPVGPK